MTLFDECIEALGKNITILSNEDTKKMFDSLVSDFPVTFWGRIDWTSIPKHQSIHNISSLVTALIRELGEGVDRNVFLLWNYSDAPAVIADIVDVVKVIDDVIAVGSDTWLYNPLSGYVVEFYHEGQITLGFVDRMLA